MQMELFLDKKITRKDYRDMADEYISKYGKEIEQTKFYEMFMERIPDLCTFYVDEPGDEMQKESQFRRGMQEAYRELKGTCE